MTSITKGRGTLAQNLMEIWDSYFRDGTPAGVELIRGAEIPAHLYHMACEVLIQHKDGDYLLVRRALSKLRYGGCFEATAAGAALKGEGQ